MIRKIAGIKAENDIVQRIQPIEIIEAVLHGEVYEVDQLANDRGAGEPGSDLDFIMKRADEIIDNITLGQRHRLRSGFS